MEQTMAGPLEGIVVVDFSQLAQGPFATQILGDLGAEIIKIEAPSGDWMRGYSLQNAYAGGMSVSFITYNRNKRSIVLDLKSADGVEIARRLIDGADVLVENFRPGVMSRLGLSYDDLAVRNPRLVYCASVGYGQDGPYVARPGQDLLVQSLAGLASLGGREQDPPAPAGIGVADLAAGLHIVYGVLAALIARERTGKGQRVDVNMLNSMLALEGQEIASYLYTGSLARRAPSGIASAYAGAPLGIYPTADGWLALSMQPLGRLAELLGVDDFAGIDSSNVIEDRDLVKRSLEEKTRTRTTNEWLEHLLAHDVWCAPVNDLDRVVEDPQVLHNDILVTLDHPTAGPIRVVGSPVRFSGTPSSVREMPPDLGEHTAVILREVLGMTDDQIAAARGRGAFGKAQPGPDTGRIRNDADMAGLAASPGRAV
jgi:crotonobetainyl-CoA:carnitine CoA-transferase CaiB-like acyl-CoA transferase